MNVAHSKQTYRPRSNFSIMFWQGLQLKSNNPNYKRTFGCIFLFDFNQADVPPLILPIDWIARARTINPRGISLWTDRSTGIY